MKPYKAETTLQGEDDDVQLEVGILKNGSLAIYEYMVTEKDSDFASGRVGPIIFPRRSASRLLEFLDENFEKFLPDAT